MLKKILEKRQLPPLLQMNDGRPCTEELWPERRQELLTLLQHYLYGYTPAFRSPGTGEVLKEDRVRALAGKAIQQEIRIRFATPGGDFHYPLHVFLPKANPRAPLFLYLSFRSDFPDRYCPIEEIVDAGFALAILDYQDVVNDRKHGDYSDGMAASWYKVADKQNESPLNRSPHQWGKIGMWAFAASRAVDYLLTREEIHPEQISVIGHSRLGKTALWCAAQDERIMMAIANNSGIFGAAVAKHSSGERIRDFLRAGSWDWFCEELKVYDGLEDRAMPFDQHMVLAAIAPRYVAIGSAELDKGADPFSEYLSCVAASESYRLLGKVGLAGASGEQGNEVESDLVPNGFELARKSNAYPTPNWSDHEGEIGYHLRSGTHYLSRDDWHQYMSFMKGKIAKGDSGEQG